MFLTHRRRLTDGRCLLDDTDTSVIAAVLVLAAAVLTAAVVVAAAGTGFCNFANIQKTINLEYNFLI